MTAAAARSPTSRITFWVMTISLPGSGMGDKERPDDVRRRVLASEPEAGPDMAVTVRPAGVEEVEHGVAAGVPVGVPVGLGQDAPSRPPGPGHGRGGADAVG